MRFFTVFKELLFPLSNKKWISEQSQEIRIVFFSKSPPKIFAERSPCLNLVRNRWFDPDRTRRREFGGKFLVPGLHRKSIARPCRQLRRCQEFFRFFGEVEVPSVFFQRKSHLQKLHCLLGGGGFSCLGFLLGCTWKNQVDKQKLIPSKGLKSC